MALRHLDASARSIRAVLSVHEPEIQFGVIRQLQVFKRLEVAVVIAVDRHR